MALHACALMMRFIIYSTLPLIIPPGFVEVSNTTESSETADQYPSPTTMSDLLSTLAGHLVGLSVPDW